MRGNVGPANALHDVADSPRRSRPAGHGSDVAIRGYATWRDPPDNREDTRREIARSQFRADRRAVPCAWESVMPEMSASVGAISAGEAPSSYLPGLMPAP